MIGQNLSHFKITAKLGEGGMGEVYRAEDTKLRREVAIKVLPEAFTSDPERFARFEREAHVLASLNHPNIAAIYDLSEDQGTHFLVLELAEGEDLAARLSRGPVPIEDALPLALQIAEALEVAHEKGIVHRDLKPANVMVGPDGQAKVLDFGLAKAWEVEGKDSGSLSLSPTLTAQMTQAGTLLGTAAYMSPEQARGENADRRADIWAFGVVLMEMLTAKTVYAGKTVSDSLAGVLAREPEWDDLPDETPRQVRRLLERCLEKEVTERLQAIGEARIAIKRYLEEPEAEELAFAPDLVTQPTWRRTLPWTLVAAALAVALVATFWPDAPASEPPHPPLRLSVNLPGEETLFRGYGSSTVLSPDGTRVAYALGDIGQSALVLRSLDQWVSRRVVEGSGQDQPYHPFFSPNGEWLGFVTRTALKKVPATGGTPITLSEVNLSRGASWGFDGVIVFAPNPMSSLFHIPAAGGEPEALTTLDEEAGEVTHRWPQVLPGGRAVIFTSHTQINAFDDAAIEILLLETGERRVLHHGGSYGRYVPSGHLVYANEGTLFAMPFDLETLTVSGSAAPVIEGVSTNSGQGGAQFSVSREGTLVYAVGVGGASQYTAVWVDREGQATPFWEGRQDYRNPRLSPDGTRLAVDILTGENRDVWVYDLERDVATRLTFDEAADTYPVWSPDGEFILFSSDRDGVGNLYRKAADGSSEVERLAESEVFQGPWSVSPDGKLLAYVEISPETSWDIWLLPLEAGAEPRLFLATPFVDGGPVFSPDGRWIAYFSDESGTSEVYVRPASGARGKWQVSSGGGIWPFWSSDGRELFYRNFVGGLKAVAVETEGATFRPGRARQLFQAPFVSWFTGGGEVFGRNNYYHVAPDGERFVMFQEEQDVSSDGHEHLRVVLNWFDELERIFAGTSG